MMEIKERHQFVITKDDGYRLVVNKGDIMAIEFYRTREATPLEETGKTSLAFVVGHITLTVDVTSKPVIIVGTLHDDFDTEVIPVESIIDIKKFDPTSIPDF